MVIFGFRVPMMASLLVWCAIWEIVGQADLTFFLPPLSSVVMRIFSLVQESTWHAASLRTLNSFLIGMAISIGAGVPLGILMGRLRAVDDVLGLWVNVFSSAPLSALVPILLILFGLGDRTVIVTVVLFAIWIIVLDTRAGVLHVPSSLVEMARTYGASRVRVYTRVILWSALPEILAGIRLGVIRGVKGVVIGQILIAIIGYGELFELYTRNFDMVSFWALALLLFAAALLLSGAIELLEKRVEYFASAR